MASKKDIIKEVREQVGPDVTESVIGQVLDTFEGDKKKALDFFRESVGGEQAHASFDQCVNYLRDIFPIDGAPNSFYEECVRRSNNDMSVAYDLAKQARDKMLADTRSKNKTLPQLPKGPTASPVVSPPIYQPASSSGDRRPPSKPLPAAAPVQPPKSTTEPKHQEEPPKPKQHEEPPKPKQHEEPPKPKQREEPPKPKKASGISADEKAKQNEAALMKMIEEQEKNAEERKRLAEEQDKRLKKLQEEKDSILLRSENLRAKENTEETKKEETVVVEPSEKPASSPEDSVLSTGINDEDTTVPPIKPIIVPPDYMKGRLPTDMCEIEVSVTDMNIGFNWKIREDLELSAKDWIGLYIHDRQYSNKYESYVSLGGKREGSASFTAPGIGYFDLRFYQNNGSEEKSRSEPFIVGVKMDVKAKMNGRRKIDVTWDRSIETSGDWIALYPVSTYSNAKYIQQIPASSANSDGVITFDAPRQPGEYEVRYFFSSKRHGSGYAFSGKSEHIVIPNEDKIEVEATHPIVKVRWQTFSQEPNSSDWIGLYDSKEDNAKRLGWEYLSTKGLMDSVGDHGIAEINVKELSCLAPEGELPEGSDKWEVRLFNKAPNQPFLRAPFVKPQ